MSDIVIDSSVVAKWFLPEPDSALAVRLRTEVPAEGSRLIVLDLYKSTHGDFPGIILLRDW